jgi:hypothetical protein
LRDRVFGFRACYQEALQEDRQLSGSVAFRIVVDRFGYVAHARVTASTLANEKATTCMTRDLFKILVGLPLGGQIGVIETVISFRPAPKN